MTQLTMFVDPAEVMSESLGDEGWDAWDIALVRAEYDTPAARRERAAREWRYKEDDIDLGLCRSCDREYGDHASWCDFGGWGHEGYALNDTPLPYRFTDGRPTISDGHHRIVLAARMGVQLLAVLPCVSEHYTSIDGDPDWHRS